MPSQRQDKDFADIVQQSVEVSINPSSLDEAILWMQGNLDPEDVFSNKQLESWAESNGYIKE